MSGDKTLTEIELVHMGGDRMLFPIVGYTSTEILISFPMNGVYEIRVKTNTIPKMKFRWKAADHEELKRIHRILNKQVDTRVKERRYAT